MTNKKRPLARWQITLLIVVALLPVAFFFVRYFPILALAYSRGPDKTPEEFVKILIIDPLPASMRREKTLRLSDPLLGDGGCDVAYTMDPADFELILKAKSWNPGLGGTMVDERAIFESVWPSAGSELETYYDIHEYPSAKIIVSPDHTKAVFLIWL